MVATPDLLELLNAERVWLNGPGSRVIGYRIKQTATHSIEVHEMLYNWRIVRVPLASPLTTDRAYCCVGKDLPTFLRACISADVWDGADDTDPPWFSKNAITGEWKEREA